MTMLGVIAVAVFLVPLVCITWWASPVHRRTANVESAMLPLLLSDEAKIADARADALRPHQ